MDRGVFLFNFSDVIPAKPGLEPLKKVLRSATSELFIVAAGNNGDDIANLQLSPIGWKKEVPTILGVAAADATQILGQFKDGNGILQDGSNYGKEYVQLAAPGKDVYSTSHGNSYSVASGTSQAVPQVTAVAAILFAKGITNMQALKQRLMYTADWYSQFQDKLWGGGLLNARRAVWEPNRNLLRTQSDHDHVNALVISGSPIISIRDGTVDSIVSGVALPSQLRFSDVLRISLQSNLLFRIIYQQQGALRVLTDVQLEGTINCAEFKEWDPDSKTFKPSDGCKEGIAVQQVYDYVAKTPPMAKD
jgi:hypothetical protein